MPAVFRPALATLCLPYAQCDASVMQCTLSNSSVACWPTRDALFSAARALELLLLQELAAANCRRLLDFCRRLQAAVSAEALHIPPGYAQLGGTAQRQAAIPAAAPLDFHEALALASACWLAADGSRGSALQVSVGLSQRLAAHS